MPGFDYVAVLARAGGFAAVGALTQAATYDQGRPYLTSHAVIILRKCRRTRRYHSTELA